ncbi:Protein deglycase [Spironucleus salmonicida]|uniref:4-methyl-5-thiazole monophosphate biosynthesis enzyme n=2 Tax=Spironucleus salmonicida TaxID=348837 RepID=V6LF38_9EUKA|nr:Protein deglycase [Spironucleus salmonicida]|eukprot:EST43112.1 4-methyl-5-thiazole monophosphate biosynthesis enzyme [Spironucleus salmonicida]
MPSALLYMFEGCEEIETYGTADILRRAGVKVTLFATTKTVTGNQGMIMTADSTTVVDADAIIIPGGMGFANLEADMKAKALVESYVQKGKLVCAMCAAPQVLTKWGVWKGLKVCGYPGCEAPGNTFVDDRVVVGDKHVCAKGPGVALEFGVAIATKLGADGEAVRKGTLMQ